MIMNAGKKNKEITFANAINDAQSIALRMDNNVICYGLGADDPKRIFGTTEGLQEEFGKDRVFDMPTSENAMTGIAVGASLAGVRPIMIHQRLDFFLLAMDQLVNSAAKWYYTFNGQSSVPITIRLILGRGWGQGPTHSQNLQAWFAHIPGLKVVMPAFPDDAKGLLMSSIFDDNPVVFLEHRWLHNMKGVVPEGDYRVPLGKARTVREGNEITIVSMSYMTIEGVHAVELLNKLDISCELVDLRTVSPIDWDEIFKSVKKTGRLLVLDTGAETGSISGEIITRVAKECWDELKTYPDRVAMPDCPEPTSYGLTDEYYPDHGNIAVRICDILGVDNKAVKQKIVKKEHHDVPGSWFKGPF